MRAPCSILVRSIANLPLLLMLAGPAGAQASDVNDAGQVSERVDVRRIEIDAMVSDRKGRPVTGLERDDFEILVDGEPAPIVNFYAVDRRAAAPTKTETPRGASLTATEVPPLMLAIAVDSSNVETGARNEALDGLRSFLRAQLGPEDRVMLIEAGRSAGLAPPVFTDRIEVALEGLDRIAATASQDRRLAEFREIMQEIGASLAGRGVLPRAVGCATSKRASAPSPPKPAATPHVPPPSCGAWSTAWPA